MLPDSAINLSIQLPEPMCFLLQLPLNSHEDCCQKENISTCIRCKTISRFISSEDLDAYYSLGHVICLVIGGLNIFICILAILSNSLIIEVLRRHKSKSSLEIMLVFLAIVDLIYCVSAAVHTLVVLIWIQNASRNAALLTAYVGFFDLGYFFRALSAFLAVAISLERYLAIAYPLKVRIWFTRKRTKWIATGCVFLSLVMSVPRLSSFYIGKNNELKRVASLTHLDYLIFPTKLYKFWNVDTSDIMDRIEFLAPLPFLLIFNGLTYLNLRKIRIQRKELSGAEGKEINSARMLIPVIGALLVGNAIVFVVYTLFGSGTLYREAYLIAWLSLSVVALDNLPIYCKRNKVFREETKEVVSDWIPYLRKYLIDENSR